VSAEVENGRAGFILERPFLCCIDVHGDVPLALVRMIRRLPRKLLFLLYISIVTFTLLEACVRLWGYSERHICDPIYMPFNNSQDIPYVHKPNLSNARARGLAIINTDSMGLRSKTAGEQYGPHQDNEFRIALVGDSVTFGEGVRRNEETFAQVLEDTLNRRQGALRVKVFNFGASAYSVRVMTATLRQRMLKVEPDLVLMAIIPADFNLARTPSVDSSGYLTDYKLSGFMPKNSRVRLLLRKAHLLYLIRDIVYPFLDQTRGAEDILSAGELPESYTYLKEFKETAEQLAAEQRKLSYSIVLLPSLSRFGKLSSQLQADGVSFVDLSNLRGEFTQDQFQASKFDPHPSAMVHRRIGESLAAYILENNFMTARK
jgi:hypothetical protein